MKKIREAIGDKKLSEIMIPGTHNAGSWDIYDGAVDDVNLALKYSRNQEDDIYSQLVHGIRYLDLRVSHYPETTEKYWINHGDFRMGPLQELLDDVRKFVKETSEIVIVDIHQLPVGFSGPNDEAHGPLVQLLEEGLGPEILYLKSFNQNLTLNEIWQSKKTVYVTYPYQNATFPSSIDFLWPGIDDAWPNANKLEELETYLEETLPKMGCQGNLYAAGVQFTPTAGDIILQPSTGLRGLAQMVNYPVTTWFRRPAWYANANIVSGDFYLGNNLIEMAIDVNTNRQNCVV